MGRKNSNKKWRNSNPVPPASTILKVIANLCFAIGLSSLLSFFEFHHIENIKNGIGFFFLFAIIGLCLCIPFYILVYKTVPELKKRQKINRKWSSALSGLGMGLFFWTPCIASYINRSFPANKVQCNDYRIIRKGTSGGMRYSGYYLIVFMENGEKKVKVFKPVWEKSDEGQTIQLCIQRGILGFEYIKAEV
jgi:hypothetical protein